MIRILTLFLLILYYCYFYLSIPSAVPEAPTTAFDPRAAAAAAPQYRFTSNHPKHFQLTVNGQSVWEHTLDTDSYQLDRGKIVSVDVCHGIQDGTFLPATGENLYEYFKSHLETKHFLRYKENRELLVQQEGNVFYYECGKGRIQRLHICPSGSTFDAHRCRPVNVCTGQKDSKKFPASDKFHYLECIRGQPTLRPCPKDFIFHVDRCESMRDFKHFCDYYPDESFLLDDNKTRVKCLNGKVTHVRCTQPHTQFFDQDDCEPDDCVGKADGSKIPLPDRKQGPFHFTPGYRTCRNGKVQHDIRECPQNWDDFLSNGDNLTFLPMVFDGQRCSIPTFCENVFSHDPDTIVPIHEFTKHVKNWSLSKRLDESVGYMCEGGTTRKRKHLTAGYHIHNFKMQKLCDGQSRDLYPLYKNTRQYYDCGTDGVVDCPPGTFFNGLDCKEEAPSQAVRYNDFPFFQFDPLNYESWIKTWDYTKNIIPQCSGEEDLYNELYNICLHPDCQKVPFLSQIPDVALLLPREHQSKCQFDPDTRRLKKRAVEFEYRFWEQRAVYQGADTYESCVPGQTLKSGNIIWDSSIYATCDIHQPFVFCPSGRGIMKVKDQYACTPPDTDTFILNQLVGATFSDGEIRKILPIHNHTDTSYRLNRAAKIPEILPRDGLDISIKTRVNLTINQPVKIQLRYRVTHPPHIAFEYKDSGERVDHVSTPNQAFLVRKQTFSHKGMTFPTYEPIPHTPDLTPSLFTT